MDTELYEDAVTHFFGGPGRVLGEADVMIQSRRVGTQRVRLAGPGVSFRVTTMDPANLDRHEVTLQHFLDHTALLALQWVNIHRSRVTFKTLRKTS